jgi:riboflavin kinase / FMN adenylyltransferase
MEIYRNLSEIAAPFPRACVTIGNFDGVHLGHQILFSEVVGRAHRQRGTSVVITFEPHPLKVLCPHRGIKLISTFEQKVELIAMANIDVLVVLPFTQELAATPAETFVDEVLINKVGIHELVIGYDYAMGRNRQGNIDFLKEQGEKKGFPVTVVEPFYEDCMLVSSTKIRELVAEGRMRAVRKLLGRYYQLRGEVKRGKQRGGPVIGFPTANLHLSEEDLCPKHGVYVTQVVYNGKCYGGVLNIGYNPTFGGEQHISAETHIFNFNEDIYGKPIKINLLRHLRGERKFSSVKELSEQIARDIERARKILADAQKELLLSCEERYNR